MKKIKQHVCEQLGKKVRFERESGGRITAHYPGGESLYAISSIVLDELSKLLIILWMGCLTVVFSFSSYVSPLANCPGCSAWEGLVR